MLSEFEISFSIRNGEFTTIGCDIVHIKLRKLLLNKFLHFTKEKHSCIQTLILKYQFEKKNEILK